MRTIAGVGEPIRRASGALVLATVAAIAFGFDGLALAHVPSAPTNGIESRLVGWLASKDADAVAGREGVAVARWRYGTVAAARLYQLVRQDGPVQSHTFTIEFLDPCVHAYTFTFG